MVSVEIQSLKDGTALSRLYFKLATSSANHGLIESGRFPPRWKVRMLRRAADRGHIGAMSELGWLLLYHGATRTDKRKGIEYIRLAARRDDPEAQFQMGRIYDGGLELYPKDPKQAIHWFTLAAEQHHSAAAEFLAQAYAEGKLGLEEDQSVAREWKAVADAESAASVPDAAAL